MSWRKTRLVGGIGLAAAITLGASACSTTSSSYAKTSSYQMGDWDTMPHSKQVDVVKSEMHRWNEKLDAADVNQQYQAFRGLETYNSSVDTAMDGMTQMEILNGGLLDASGHLEHPHLKGMSSMASAMYSPPTPAPAASSQGGNHKPAAAADPVTAPASTPSPAPAPAVDPTPAATPAPAGSSQDSNQDAPPAPAAVPAATPDNTHSGTDLIAAIKRALNEDSAMQTYVISSNDPDYAAAVVESDAGSAAPIDGFATCYLHRIDGTWTMTAHGDGEAGEVGGPSITAQQAQIPPNILAQLNSQLDSRL